MLALALLLTLSQTPQHMLFRQPNLPTTSFAFFEAFPASGAGTAGVCSTTAPTGAKGETLTFTRGSNGTCTKTATGGLATTGIANGDLVVLSSNVARVEYDSQGVLGLLVESARTNSLPRSEALDNATWTWENSGAAATTRTADYAVAPDGATTAERLEIPATSGAQYSDTYQTFTVAAASGITCSVFVRGTSASGTTDLCGYDGAAWSCSDCAFASDSWARCSKSWASGTGTSRFCKLGNNSNQNGGAARTAVDVLAWGFQGEAGAYPTSYIPTTSAAVTRSAETATFPGASLPANPYSLAVSFYPPTATTQGDLFYGNAGSTSGVAFFFVASLLRSQNCSSGCATFSPAYAPTALTTTRLATSSTGGQQQTFVNGSSLSGPTATAAAAAPWATATGIGPGIGQPDAIISRICVDPDPSRCR